MRGQVRISSRFSDAHNSDENMIRVKFGEGNEDPDQDDQTKVRLDSNNVAKGGKLQIRFYDGKAGKQGSREFEKTYDFGSGNLTDVEKKQINDLGLFKVQ